MPHVSFVSFSGLRVRQEELSQLGASLPGLGPRTSALRALPSLGLLTLAGMLPDDWSCSYRDIDRADDAVLNSLIAERPTIVAMTALTASSLESYSLSVRLRKQGVRTLLGGLHATSCTDEASFYFDGVVAGEGELVWPQILEDAALDRLKPVYSAVRSPTELPYVIPRFSLAACQPGPRWTLQTQRGCPLACEFCGASRTISRFREKPVEQIRAEMDAIERLTPQPWIELADDNTFAGPRDPTELLEVLQRSSARFFTEVDWRIGERHDLLPRLASAGCVQVLVGIESLVFRFPGMGDKGDSLARIMRAIDRIQDHGIVVNGCLIVGADGETTASIDRLAQFVDAAELGDVQITISTPFPGTLYRSRLARQGRLLPDRDWSHYTLFDLTFQPDRMTVEELEHAYRELLVSVYDDAHARRRALLRRQIWQRNPSLRGAHVQ